MSTTEAAVITELGVVGATRFSLALTDSPWNLDIDTVAVSVGAGVGILGAALREVFPDAAWSAIEYDRIDARHPRFFELSPTRRPRALLVNPREFAGDEGELSDDLLQLAVTEALRVAAEGGTRALGMPLLTTGMLNRPVAEVAEVLLSAAIGYEADGRQRPLDRLVIFCRAERDAQMIAAEFARAMPEFSAQPVGGLSSDLVDPNIGIPLNRDQLAVAPYVSMLATVIADRETPLPLSVGVFGAWGSGKSYFMAMLRDRVEWLAGANDRYCTEIVQIGFNAWHYTDSNLWASLGDEIFRQLAGSETDARDRADRIRRELAQRVDQRRQLELATREAGITAAELRAEIDRASADRETTAGDLLTALRKSGEFRRRIDDLWRRLGVEDQAVQARLLAEEMHGTLTEVRALRQVPSEHRGRIALAVAAVVLLLGVLGALLAPAVREWFTWLIGVFALCAGTGVTWLLRARSGVQQLREIAQDLHTGLRGVADAAAAEDMSQTLDRLRAAEAVQNVAQAQLADVVAQVGELGRQLAQLEPGRRLHNFIAERAHSDAYSGNLGLLSTVRKDFEQLVELMVEWRTSEQEWDRTRRPVDRIVLYIDDLDRCRPEQVVEVLQAVHLLLAFELFVVVVGVDPRWLLRSLRSSYADMLYSGDHDDPEELRRTPEDYLEKILNIPLVLPAMSSDSLHRLLRSLAPADAPTAGSGETDGARDATSAEVSDAESDSVGRMFATVAPNVDTGVISVEDRSEVDQQQRVGPALPPPRPLTEPELRVLGALDELIGTPREAKRLVNLYRMIRATRDLSEGSRFLGRYGEHGEFQAVVVLLGLLAAGGSQLLSSVLDGPPGAGDEVDGGLECRPSDTPLSRFVADLEPFPGGDGWRNRVVGAIPETHVLQWRRLHSGLVRVTDVTTLTDLTELSRWLPLVRRFSYVLPSPGVLP